jgi:glycosyltransferase involved in cell wall biosynthesis
MRIAIVTNLFLPKWVGGLEVATLSIAQHLEALGHDVHIVTSRDEGMPPESSDGGIHLHRVYRPGFLMSRDEGMPPESSDGGIHLHRVYRPSFKSIGTVAFYLTALYALNSINPQIIHVQNVLLGPCGFLAKRILKRPYVVSSHGYGFRNLTYTAAVLKDADAVTALTDDMRKQLQKIWQREIYVIPNGINPERFERVSREEARRQLSIEASEKIVLYVGGFRPIKGVKYLIMAMQRIRHDEPNAKLILAGSGPDEGGLRLIVKELGLSECVRFVGAVQNDAIPVYMVASDVLVLPSLSEGFPMVSLEAMAASLPVVATKVGGTPSIIEEGINGFLVKPRDAAEIADKASSILGDRELSDFISRNNKTKAQRYTWASVVHDLEKVYIKCVAGS